ncbi:MAG: hypothetical protein RR710_09165 [Oscillospiraceae bacterium]
MIMGEWSEYFEDFPEENPANQKREPDLGPMSLAFPHLHLSQLTKAELAIENSRLDELEAEEELQKKERADFVGKAKSKPVYKVETCPICSINKMNIYKISNDSFYCECGECNVSGDGPDIIDIFTNIEIKVWANES